MPAPQIVHLEEVELDARIYTVSVSRVAGGLAGQWHCPCGAAQSLSTTHLKVDDAVQEAKRSLEQHQQRFHAAKAQP